MSTNPRERLARIRRFDQLVAYLRDDLDWPIGSDDFEELTFDYTPEELGIDAKNAAKIQEIKRLRRLVPDQPWGIFFVKFEPKRLPVVALRRILGRVVLKKRAVADSSKNPAWAADDLLFLSNYGEGEDRRIALAHFSSPGDSRDLPTLKVLGWDNLDTALHLDAVASKLTENLSWPDQEDDQDAWRGQWRAAFSLGYREVITTSKQLSERLAVLARSIRDRIRRALAIETNKGPLTKLMKAFQTALINDLDEARFADMYAQTIAYGLLSARITDPTKGTADDLAAHLRTNPFLNELLEEFFHVGGRQSKAGGSGIDFDELGVSDVVELLDQANMEAVVQDFGNRNPREDPVIHFYEHFLTAYDKKQKIERGSFYTPRPVVSYIVRSVDKLLRTEFGLGDGLADTTTWGEMVKCHKALNVPEDTSPEQTFVQILDPATGTGTFLVETIDLIHKTMIEKWKTQGHGEKKIEVLWNNYVPKHLLPRLHGYELLMAPYAIAHLKIGLKLYETGYRFESDERANVYLTDALEPPTQDQLTFVYLPALAHEAQAVNVIKEKQPFTVVIGNPPYLGEAGRGGRWIAALMRGEETQSDRSTFSYFEVEGKPLKERNSKWLNNDYVKFIRLAHWQIERSGRGVIGFITDHSYLNSPTFRGMRESLRTTFSLTFLLDLHGNLKKKEGAPDGGEEENVFDIQQGVAIGLFVKKADKRGTGKLHHAELWGLRESKYEMLLSTDLCSTEWGVLLPQSPFYLFVPQDTTLKAEYEQSWKITDVMRVNGVGMTTARDHMVVDFDKAPLLERAREFRDSNDSDEGLCRRLGIPLKKGWNIPKARNLIEAEKELGKHIRPVLYRPFDRRLIFYHDSLVWRTVKRIMLHMLAGENVGFITTRQTKDEWGALATWNIIAHKTCSAYDINSLFPLYLYPGVGKSDESLFNRWAKGKDGRTPNLDSGFVEQISTSTELRFVSDGSGDLGRTFGPEDVLAWIYAVFYSPRYRTRYEAYLKIDFPRVPLPKNVELFRKLVEAGHELLVLHVLESLKLGKPITTYTGPTNPVVGRGGWSEGTVWLDARKTIARKGHRATKPGTIGFQGVPEEVWDFKIGGYQVCHKWLKDRKGRMLSDKDITFYQKIIVALNETIRIMAKIDEVIEAHGGWPDAFWTGSKADAKSEKTTMVVPIWPRMVEPAPEDRYITCVPFVPLRAAAGGFSDPQHIEDDYFDWVAVKSRYRLRKGMFVAQVIGKSMEPLIPDRAWCLFRAPVIGTRQGKIVLVQLRDATDPETGQRYTVKRYKSKKAVEDDSWYHLNITLEPANPDFKPIELINAEEGELNVIAEMVEILEG